MALQTNTGGSLYELVARGVKDSYFFDDSATGVNPFSWKYDKYPAVQTETRHLRPQNAVSFGKTITIDIDHYGDVLEKAFIHLRLPSWVPEPLRAAARRGRVRADVGGESYGYCSAVGYMVFKKIEILQDNIILQEVTGDALYVVSRQSESWNKHHYSDYLAGVYDEADSVAMERTAVRVEDYIISLPFIADFPLLCLRGQRFRLRLTLRDVDEIVVCSDRSIPKPTPWSVGQYRLKTSAADVGATFAPVRMVDPEVTLEVVQTYLSNDDRDVLSKATYTIPYRRYYSHNTWTFGQNTYNAAAPIVVKNYDGHFFVDRIVTVMRSARSLEANRRTDYSNAASASGYFISELQSAYGSTVRDQSWGPLVLNRLTQHAHGDYGTELKVFIQDYGFDSVGSGVATKSFEPPAGLNYSEAVDANLRLILENIETNFYDGLKISELTILLCATAFYKIENGRGGLAYLN